MFLHLGIHTTMVVVMLKCVILTFFMKAPHFEL